MTDRLNGPSAQRTAKRSEQEWLDRGNAYLWGRAPAEHGSEAGSFIKRPRPELEWRCKDGHYFISERGR